MELKEVLRLNESQGESSFRARIILATLSGKAIKLDQIHSQEEEEQEQEQEERKSSKRSTNGMIGLRGKRKKERV